MANDITYEDMNPKYGAKSELTKRAEGKREQVADMGTVPQFFQEERRKSKMSGALSDARRQSEFMGKAMKMERDQFDTALLNTRKLAKLDRKNTHALVEAETKFREDSAGRKYMSERQITDWYATRAQGEEDWNNYQLRQGQLHDRKLQVLQAAYSKLDAEERNAYKAFGANLDQQTRAYMAKRKSELRDKIAKEKNRAANSSALTSALATVGSLAGGAAMSWATPLGMAGGAAAGGAAGTYAGMLISKQGEDK